MGDTPKPPGGRPHFPPATHIRSSCGCPVGPVKVVASLRSAKRGRLATVSHVSEARSVETKQAPASTGHHIDPSINNVNIWKVIKRRSPPRSGAASAPGRRKIMGGTPKPPGGPAPLHPPATHVPAMFVPRAERKCARITVGSGAIYFHSAFGGLHRGAMVKAVKRQL